MVHLFHFIRSVLGCMCLALAWLIPDLIPPWNTFYREAFAVLAVILLSPWSALRVWPLRLILFGCALAGIIVVQSLTHNLALGDVVLGVLIALFACMAASTGAQLASEPLSSHPVGSRMRPIEVGCFVLLFAALINALIGFAQWQGIARGLLVLETTGRVYGNLAQPNHFATLLVIALGALVYLDKYARLRGMVLCIAAGILVLALVASESRTGALSFTLLVFCVAAVGHTNSARFSLRWLVPLLVIFWLLYICWPIFSSWMSGSFTRAGIPLGSSSRFELWGQSIEALKLKPLLGYGWLHVGEAQNAVAHYLGGAVNMDHTHLLFLDLLVWFGIPIGLFLGIACLAWLGGVVRSTLNCPVGGDAFFYLIIMLPIAVHSMLEYPYAYTYFFLVFAFFAGAVEGSLGNIRNITRIERRGFLFFAVVGVLCSIWVAWEYRNVEEDYRALRLEREFITGTDMLHNFHASPILLTQYGQLVASQRTDAKAPEESRLVHVARSVAMRFPLQRTHQHYYFSLLRNGHCDEAARQRLVIASLFGVYGTTVADRDQRRFNIDTSCQDNPKL